MRITLASTVLEYIYTSLDVMVLHHKKPCGVLVALPYNFLYGWVNSNFIGIYIHCNTLSENIININELQ